MGRVTARAFWSMGIVLMASSFAWCGEGFSVPAPRLSTAEVSLREPIEPVNRRVMGVCLIYPPMDEKFAKEFEGVLDGASGIAWAINNFDKKDEITEENWQSFMPFVRAVGIKELNGFSPMHAIKRKAHYVSPDDNNLDPHHQPSAVAEMVGWINKKAHPGFPDGYGLTGWEIWNEPQFPQHGAWPVKDYARYAIDCAKAVRQVDWRVKIGVALHMGNMDWNRRMLSAIAAEDIKSIGYVVSHPYNFSWIGARRTMGSYYARVSGSAPMREGLRNRVRLVQEIGHNRWPVVASEWNTHPQGYAPPWSVSTDMAAAVHVAAMFGVFWDVGVDSAQFFELRGRGKGHFHLATQTEDGIKFNPTGEVFRLYGRYFRGNRLDVKLDTPTYHHPRGKKAPLDVPVVFTHAAHDAQARRLTLILANRHIDADAPVTVDVSGFRPTARHATRITVTAKGTELTETIVKTDEDFVLPAGSDPRISITLPPHSVTALLITGDIPPTEEELFSKDLSFLREWRIGKIMDPSGGADHGLAAALPQQATRGDITLLADSTGFVNIAKVLEVSGRSGKLAEGFQTVATTWIFSPISRQVQWSLGLDYWGVLSVNGREVFAVKKRSDPAAPNTHRFKAGLDAGWNRLALRVSSGSEGMGFWLALQATGDLLRAVGDDRPPWPCQWHASADQGCDVSRHSGRLAVPRPVRTSLELSSGKGTLRRAFVRWPAIAMPEGVDADGVRARIVLTRAYHRGEGRVWIRPVLEGWNETTVCFNKQPRMGEPLAVKADAHEPQWVFEGPEVDKLVRSWLKDPSGNHGIAVGSDVPYYAAFCSDDNANKETAPRLELYLEESEKLDK